MVRTRRQAYQTIKKALKNIYVWEETNPFDLYDSCKILYMCLDAENYKHEVSKIDSQTRIQYLLRHKITGAKTMVSASLNKIENIQGGWKRHLREKYSSRYWDIIERRCIWKYKISDNDLKSSERRSVIKETWEEEPDI